MKFLKRFFGTIIVLILLLVIAGFFLPSSSHVERSTVMQAAPEAIFPHINNLKNWNQWSPWAKMDPNMQQTYEGPEAGTGAKVSWSSEHEHVGSGSQEITESVENQLVRTALDFGEQGQANAALRIEPVDEGSLVTWEFDSNFGYNIIGRYFGLMMDKWIGGEYEKGLANLKSLVESN